MSQRKIHLIGKPYSIAFESNDWKQLNSCVLTQNREYSNYTK